MPENARCPRCGGNVLARWQYEASGSRMRERVCVQCGRSPDLVHPEPPADQRIGPQPGFHVTVRRDALP